MPTAGGVTVRPAADGDLDACVRLADLVDAGIPREWFANDLGDPERLLVVAEVDGAVVGYGRAGRFEPDDGAAADVAPAGYYLFGVVVEPGYRRLGAATALTESRVAWIRGRASEALYFTNARNAASIELHDRLGFAEATRDFTFPGVSFDGGVGVLFRLGFDA